jgi:hypothetical protein
MEEDISTCLESRQVSSTSAERMNLGDYACGTNLSKLTMVPGCSIILRLSSSDAKLILIRCFAQLASLHRNNKTLDEHLDAAMFIILLADNTVMLEILNQLHIQPYTKVGGDLDYGSFVTMVKRLYCGKPIPLDVFKWLEVISKGTGYWLPKQIVNHIYMMDDTTAFGAFQSMYHSFLEFEKDKNTDFWNMVHSKKMRKHTSWNLRYFECSLLWEAFIWTDHSGRRTWYEPNVKGLLQLVRNCWEHSVRLLQGFLLCILLATHPDLLPDVQKALSDAGYLKHLRM